MYEIDEGMARDDRRPRTTRSLADARAGETVEVGDIVFESLRDYCPTVGVIRGQTLQCLGRTPDAMLLRRSDGRRITIDRCFACFVGIHTAVAPVHPEPRARGPRAAPNC